MSHDVPAEPTPTAAAPPPESIDAFLDREFATALAAELADRKVLEDVRGALAGVAAAASPSKKAWLDAVDPPQKAAADG